MTYNFKTVWKQVNLGRACAYFVMVRAYLRWSSQEDPHRQSHMTDRQYCRRLLSVVRQAANRGARVHSARPRCRASVLGKGHDYVLWTVEVRHSTKTHFFIRSRICEAWGNLVGRMFDMRCVSFLITFKVFVIVVGVLFFDIVLCVDFVAYCFFWLFPCFFEIEFIQSVFICNTVEAANSQRASFRMNLEHFTLLCSSTTLQVLWWTL